MWFSHQTNMVIFPSTTSLSTSKKCSFHTNADFPIKHCPRPVPLSSFRHSCFGPKTSPCVSQQFFACIFMYPQLVSMSKLHPSSLNNFLRSSGFNIELALPRLCLSISYIHFASFVDFPPLASPPLLTFLLFQYPNFPCISNFLHASCLNI